MLAFRRVGFVVGQRRPGFLRGNRWLSSGGDGLKVPDWVKEQLFADLKDVHTQVKEYELVVNEGNPKSNEFVQARKELDRLYTIRDLQTRLQEIDESKSEFEEMLEFEDLKESALVEITSLEGKRVALEGELLDKLIPKDPQDYANAILEIRPSAGGDEAGLFAWELFNMYRKFAQHKNWTWDEMTVKEKNGMLKEGIVSISKPSHGVAEEMLYGLLKYEGGVHRVQRVPATEKSGRVHTSTVSVYVLVEQEQDVFELNEADLQIETMRASGAGGQHVNTTDSAVRITHIPTGISVSMQDERSQHQNRKKALKVLAARIKADIEKKDRELQSELRFSLVQSGDRSEKIRTYNFARDQCTDHRLGQSVFDMIGSLLNGHQIGELESKLMVPLHTFETIENLKTKKEN